MKGALSIGILLAFVSLSSLAGEYLTNDTGQTVYGLTVAFSEPVTLTGYGDVLVIVEPAGDASSFTFSGGQLEAWDGHWLSWQPSAAFVLAHDWLSTPQADASREPTAEVVFPADVEIEYLGNPFAEKMPNGSGWEHARAVWDMQTFDGHIYLAHGSVASNPGPVDVWFFDPSSNTFRTEFAVDDESIWEFVDCDDKLLVMGPDATESHEWGNLYIFDGVNWAKHRNLPNVIHGFSCLFYDGMIFAVGNRYVTSENGVGYSDDAVFVSDDDGATWEMLLERAEHDVYWPFELSGDLYACSAYSHGVYRYVDDNFVLVPDVSLFPGLPLLEYGFGYLMTNRITFRGSLLYYGGGLFPDAFNRTPLYQASAVDTHGLTPVAL